MTQIEFSRDTRGFYVAEFTASGKELHIYLNRSERGLLEVASSPDPTTLRYCPVLRNREYPDDVRVVMRFPAGSSVRITSQTEVTAAEIMEVETASQPPLCVVAESLPEASKDTMNKIYFIPKGGGAQAPDYSDEYMTRETITGGTGTDEDPYTYSYSWERIGDTLAQLQADWNQTNTSSADYIKNKPTLVEKLNDLSDVDITPDVSQQTYFEDAVEDYDGNKYDAVIIGDQVWMAENLRTTHMPDGTAIPLGTQTSDSTPYYYHVNNDSSNDEEYGLLYNYAAVMNGERPSESNPSGVQGIAPNGWHIPSKSEAQQLKDSVQTMDGIGRAKRISSKTGWATSSVENSPGNNPNDNNESGFNAKPAGFWWDAGDLYFGENTYIACTDFLNNSNSGQLWLSYDNSVIYIGGGSVLQGKSVRCVCDLSATEFRAQMSLKGKVLMHDGNKWKDGEIPAQQQADWSQSDNTKVDYIKNKPTIPSTASDVGAIPSTEKGVANGVAELDGNGKVPAAQLPSYVDDIIEGYLYNGAFYEDAQHTTEITGETGKIYLNITTNSTYRWSGSMYIEISESPSENWIVKETASGDTSVSVDIDSRAERVRLLVNNTANSSAVNVSVDGDFVAVFSESNALTVAANTAAIIEMKRVKTDNIQYPYFVCTATQVYESFTNRTYAIGELDREEVAMCVADSNDNGAIKLIPYKYFDPLTLDTTRYTLKDFVRFHRGKNGREVVMHKLETSGIWAAWNRYRVHCDTTDAGGFTWSATINGEAKGGTVTWSAGDTLDSIVTQLNTGAESTYLVFSHESGEDFIRVRKGGHSNSTFTVTNATGTTLEDLSLYTKVGDVQQAETHRDWQAQDVVTLFPNSGYVPANTRQYSVSGYNLSYMCGSNEPRYKAVYRTGGASTYMQEDAVSNRMTEAAFNAMNGSGVEAQQQLYDKYNGSWEAYMDASMAAIDDTHTNGIEYQSYDNGDTKTAFIASVTTMDFDGSYIPAYPVGYNCWSYTDTGIVGGHFHLSTLHENLVFMRSAKMTQLNAAMAFLNSYVPLSNNSKYYWTGARYSSGGAWLYYSNYGRSSNYGLYYDLYARLLAYLN